MPTAIVSEPGTDERPDQDLLEDVHDRVWQDAGSRAIERSAMAVEVHGQEVFLLGHVTNLAYRRKVVELVRQVRGVRAIHNRLVADPELVTQVAQALAADPRTSWAVLGVGAFYGWIHLSGVVPDLPARLAADEIASGVEHVRGVLALPHLPGEHAPAGENRRPLQPRVGQPVYALDGPAGRVEQIVISPHSRLVSHIVVAGTLEINWRPIHGRWLVPMTAAAGANESGVFLNLRSSALIALPTTSPADLRQPRTDWQPPFPYRAGDVHWLVEREPAPLGAPIALFLPAPRPAARSSLAA